MEVTDVARAPAEAVVATAADHLTAAARIAVIAGVRIGAAIVAASVPT